MKTGRTLLAALLALLFFWAPAPQAAAAGDIQLLATYDVPGAGNDLAWSPDGSRLAVSSGGNITGGTISILEPSTGEVILRMGPVEGPVTSLGWSPDGTRLAFCAGLLPYLTIWNSTNSSEPEGAKYVGAMHFSWSSDGNIASDWGDLVSYNISVWNASTGAHVRSIPTNDGSVDALEFSPDGARLAAILDGKAIVIWNISNGSAASIDGTDWYGNATALSWSPDGRHLLVGMDDPVGHFNIRLFDGFTLESVGGSSFSQSGTLCVAWSPDNTTIVSGQRDGSLMITGFNGDWVDARPLGNHTAAVTSLSWSPDGKILASASPDATVRLWGAPGSLPAKRRLHLALEADSTELQVGGTVNLTVRLQDDLSAPVPGAVLSFTSDAGGFFYNRSEAGGGKYTATYKAADVRPGMAANITVNATAAGLSPAGGSIRLTVMFPPGGGRAPAVAGDNTGYIVAGGGGAIILVAAALAVTETGRYSGMLLFLPLFTRMKRTAVLDNFTRGLLQGYIIANPGVHMSAIRDCFELTNGEAAYHLRVLEREGYITSATDGFRRRFYPGERIDLNDRPQELTVAQNLLISFMEKFPGITGTELARLAGTTPQVVNYHLKKLWRLEVISMDREGRLVRCRVRAEKLRLFNRPAAETDEVSWDGSPAD